MRSLLIPALVLLASCATIDQVADDTTRSSAKAVVNAVVEEKLPGRNIEPVSDCIIDHATRTELLTLAGTAITGLQDGTAQMVLEIASRPKAVICIAKTGLGQLN